MLGITKRVSIPLTRQGASDLENLAQNDGVSQTEILRRALASYAYFMKARDGGGEIQVKTGNKIVEVVLP